MILEALWKVIKDVAYKVTEGFLKFLYLSLPLWVHMFFMQMRERVDTISSITGFVDERSTWAMIYDGVALVNTKPGELKSRAHEVKEWFKRTKVYWIILAVVILLVDLTWLTLTFVK